MIRTARTGVVVLVTAGSREEADRVATALVEVRLAACVNVIAPIESIYRWQGVVERAAEVLLVAKTRRPLLRSLIARVKTLHSYEVPETIALPIVAGARPYLEWLAAETADTPATLARRANASRQRRTARAGRGKRKTRRPRPR